MRTPLLFVFLGILRLAHAQWTDLASGIDDDLTGVYCWDTHVVVCGEHGIYFSTTAGIGTDAWTRFDIPGSPDDDARYEHTRFSGVSAQAGTVDIAYFAGVDTVEQRAIVLKVDISDQAYSFLYTGTPGSALNAITFNTTESRLFAVGNHGLILRCTDLTAFAEVASGLDVPLLSVSGNSGKLLIGGEGAYLYCLDQTSGLTVTPHLEPGSTFRGMQATTSSQHYGVGAFVYTITASFLPSDQSYFEPFPLDGRDIVIATSGSWVATGHGIYRGTAAYPTTQEFQPSGGNGPIDDILMSNGTPIGYAVGNDGLVLFTSNGGGPTMPLCGISAFGSCIGEPFTIHGSSGWSDTSCEWFLDGEPFEGYCSGSFPLLVDSPGVHELRFVVNNALSSDTAYQQVQIVTPPLIDLDVSVSDSVLCKQGTTVITISGSEPDVSYSCRDITHDVTLCSGTGTGSDLSLITSTIDVTTDVVVEARSIYATCLRTFPDTIHVRVEETQARIHHNLLNALPGEGVAFYSHCTDAQHFNWTFGPNANMSGSSLQDQAGVAFAIPGTTEIGLICWSDAGCYDTLVTEGPFIYQEAEPDSCWTMTLTGDDPTWDGYGRACITDGHDTGDGFLVSGSTYDDVLLPSRLGRTMTLSSEGGTFLAKYTYSGVLRWWVETVGDGGASIAEIATLSTGDIVLSGTRSQCRFVDASGDTLPDFEYGTGYLLSLNPQGGALWHTCFSGTFAQVIEVDSLDNLYLMGGFSGIARYWFQDVLYPFNTEAADGWTFLMRTAPSGDPIWQTYIENDFNNTAGCYDIDVDNSGNMILGGGMEHGITFRSANGGPSYLAEPTQLDYGQHLYVARYSPVGQFVWCLYAVDNEYHSSISGVALAENGDAFVTGTNDNILPSLVRNLHHSDGSITPMTGYGDFFVARLDATGHLVWGNGPLFPSQSTVTGLHMDDHRVTAVGQFYQGDNGYMSSIGTPQQWCAAGPGDFFMVVYDLNGGLQHVYVPWATLPNVCNLGYYRTPVFRDTTGTLFLLGEFRSEAGVFYYGDSIFTQADERYDGFISKAGLNCTQLPMGSHDSSVELRPALSAYPNPFTGNLLLTLPHTGEWRISCWDALGRSVCPAVTVSDRRVTLAGELFKGSTGPLMIIAECNSQRFTSRVVRIED